MTPSPTAQGPEGKCGTCHGLTWVTVENSFYPRTKPCPDCTPSAKAEGAEGAPFGAVSEPTLQRELIAKLVAIGNREQDSGNDGTGNIEVVPDDGLTLDELDLIAARLRSTPAPDVQGAIACAKGKS